MKHLNGSNFATFTLANPPTYDVSNLPIGVIHLGLGAFHRAHQAAYFESALRNGTSKLAIAGVSQRSSDVADLLAAQDCFYTVNERSGSEQSPKIFGAIRQALFYPRDRAALIAMSESQALTAITITATEKAYQVTDGHESDLPSRIAALLAARFEAKRGGLSIISCDNLTSNGELIKKLVLEASAKLDKHGLINWIERENYFPNSMVDRIVPAITAERIDGFEAEFGYRDESLLTTEPFTQWAIENCPLSQTLAGTGVEFVDDVAGYEMTKIRIFNGAHSTIAYLGELAGLEFIADGIANPAINSFIAHLQEDELAKSFTSPPGMDPIEYAKRIRKRISNLNLRHRCQQIAMDGSLKLTQRLFPTINDLLAKQLPTQYIATAIAVWLRYLEINDRISDPLAAELVPLARNSDVAIATKSVLTHEKLLVRVNPGNFEAIAQALEKLRSKPVLEVLTSL